MSSLWNSASVSRSTGTRARRMSSKDCSYHSRTRMTAGIVPMPSGPDLSSSTRRASLTGSSRFRKEEI